MRRRSHYHEQYSCLRKGRGKYVPSILFLPNYGDAPEDIEAIKKGIDMWNEKDYCEE